MGFVISCLFALSGCDLPFGGGNEEADATLYHLTLSASSNVTLNEEQKSQLKATYGYGEPSATVKEGVRDEDEIEELKKAGATDADIAKAGKRQADGSYYFFDQDPIYLEAPYIEGYKLLGFYDKTTGKFEANINLTDIDGKRALPRWNMANKDVELEARYEKCAYEYYFNTMEEGDTNPNAAGRYCGIDDGVLTLAPAITSNTHKKFVSPELCAQSLYVKKRKALMGYFVVQKIKYLGYKSV